MLKRFEVINFKQFNSLQWDFSKVRNYDFSMDCLADSPSGKFIKTALVYGRNSSGKSNLGFALFDIVQHLVDKVKNQMHIPITLMPIIRTIPLNLVIAFY